LPSLHYRDPPSQKQARPLIFSGQRADTVIRKEKERPIMTPTSTARTRPPQAAKNQTLVFASGLAIIALIMLVIVFGGDHTARYRDLLGLSRFMADKQGLYADCVRGRSKENRYCAERMGVDQRLQQQRPKFSTGPGDSIPFSLR
jgi:hypothetical protein